MVTLVNGRLLRRGDLITVDLDGNRGAEIQNGEKGSRVCIVVQNNRGNEVSHTTIVVPLSDAERNTRTLPILLFIAAKDLGYHGKDSVAHCEQIRTVDISERVIRVVGQVPPDTMKEIDRVICISLGVILNS